MPAVAIAASQTSLLVPSLMVLSLHAKYAAASRNPSTKIV
jgi:hypothetical protein